MINDHGYEYAKSNALQSLWNAQTYLSFMEVGHGELRWKLDDMVVDFIQQVKDEFKAYEDEQEEGI